MLGCKGLSNSFLGTIFFLNGINMIWNECRKRTLSPIPVKNKRLLLRLENENLNRRKMMLQRLFFKFCPVGRVRHEVSFCPSSFKNFSVKKKKIDLY